VGHIGPSAIAKNPLNGSFIRFHPLRMISIGTYFPAFGLLELEHSLKFSISRDELYAGPFNVNSIHDAIVR